MDRIRSTSLTACAVGFCFWAGTARAAQVTVSPGEDIEAAINGLAPGDELILAGGEYTLSGRLGVVVNGTEQAPIVIRAANGEVPHLIRPDASENIIDIQATWTTIEGIEFSGGSAGLRIESATELTITRCEVHDTGDVAIRANDSGQTYEALRIIENEVHHTNDTGEGMYLGCNNDACRVANGLVERNYVHHTNQMSVSQGDGIELKEGSYGTVIRDNVIHDTNYPCILTYSASGNGSANTIERNVMWNCGNHAIQSAADATIRNNIILSANADGIAMQSHQSGSPANLEVLHNTILHPGGDAISIRNSTGSVVVANNAAYAQGGSAIFVGPGNSGQLTFAGNVGAGGLSGASEGYVDGDLAADFVDGHYDGAPPIEVFPNDGALVASADPAYVPLDDFNTMPREGAADVGAYRYDADGNPGWTLAEEFKGFPSDGPDPGPGGSTGGDSGGSDSETGAASGSSESNGSTASPGSGSGSATDGDNDAATADDGDDSGCSCTTTSAPSTGWLLWVLALGLRRRTHR